MSEEKSKKNMRMKCPPLHEEDPSMGGTLAAKGTARVPSEGRKDSHKKECGPSKHRGVPFFSFFLSRRNCNLYKPYRRPPPSPASPDTRRTSCPRGPASSSGTGLYWKAVPGSDAHAHTRARTHTVTHTRARRVTRGRWTSIFPAGARRHRGGGPKASY